MHVGGSGVDHANAKQHVLLLVLTIRRSAKAALTDDWRARIATKYWLARPRGLPWHVAVVDPRPRCVCHLAIAAVAKRPKRKEWGGGSISGWCEVDMKDSRVYFWSKRWPHIHGKSKTNLSAGFIDVECDLGAQAQLWLSALYVYVSKSSEAARRSRRFGFCLLLLRHVIYSPI